MTDSDKHPVRGVNTIREELRKERDGNTYKAAFGALATAVVGTLLSYAGYEWANRIYIWLWLGTGAAWLAGIGMLVFGKQMEQERLEKIAALEKELDEAIAAKEGRKPASVPKAPTQTTSRMPAPAPAPTPTPTPAPRPASAAPSTTFRVPVPAPATVPAPVPFPSSARASASAVPVPAPTQSHPQRLVRFAAAIKPPEPEKDASTDASSTAASSASNGHDESTQASPDSALAENKMKPTRPFTPEAWEISDWRPMLQGRWKFAVAVPVAIGLIGVLYFGFKPAGSYDGYTAGSIFLPDRYTDYGTGSILEEYGYMSADQLNSILGDLRGQNMGGLIRWIVFTLAMVAVAAVFSMAYDASSRSMATLLSNDDDMYRFFRERYEMENGRYTPTTFDEALHLPLTIADYSYEWLLRPGAAAQCEDSPITEEYRNAVYRQSHSFFGRLYLLYNDLWFDASTTTAKRIFGAIGGAASTMPIGMAETHSAPGSAKPATPTAGVPSVPQPVPDATSAPSATTTAPAAATPSSASNQTTRPAPIPQPTPAVRPTPSKTTTTVPSTAVPAPRAATAPAPLPMDDATVASSRTVPPVPVPSPMTATAPTRPVPRPSAPAPLPMAAPAPSSTPVRDFKFCGQCGAKLKRSVSFCTQCGAKCTR